MTFEEMQRELAHKSEQADQFARAHSIVAGMLSQSQAAHGATRSEMLRWRYEAWCMAWAAVGWAHAFASAALAGMEWRVLAERRA